jgi:1,4-alpha-glucan branching enzyme
MNERQFGASLTRDGVSFSLWASAAKRVDLLLHTPHPMQHGEDMSNDAMSAPIEPTGRPIGGGESAGPPPPWSVFWRLDSR